MIRLKCREKRGHLLLSHRRHLHPQLQVHLWRRWIRSKLLNLLGVDIFALKFCLSAGNSAYLLGNS
jgi:hypothetical protein